jgi:beta-lactamase superfamily II metal-dependent hydrolase
MKRIRHVTRGPLSAALPCAALLLPLLVATCSEPIVSPSVQTQTAVAALVAGGGIVINEVMADPSAVSDDAGEWIEVHNTGSTTVNMTGWTLQSNNDAVHTIGTLSVPAGGYKVMITSSKRNGGITGAYVYGSGIVLANTSDWVVLRDGSGATVDSVAWSASMPAGATRGVKDPLQDNTNVNGTNWQTATTVYGSKTDRGTPGAQNDGYTQVAVVTTVVVTPSTATVAPQSTQQFTASALDQNGQPIATTFTWSSSSTAVATVSSSGLATAVSAGTALIRATSASGVWSEATLTVAAADTTGGGGGGGTAGDLVVRVLDIGQGDATYITDGVSRIFIDGGPSTTALGAHLDALGLNNTTIDVVIISHAHLDHYGGLRELFKSTRGITIRYLFENKDASTAVTLAELRDSINARVGRGQLIYRDTDDPCVSGAPTCTITMAGGSKLHLLVPDPGGTTPNNRSGAVKLVGPDSASFTMWFAGDAEHEAINWFDTGANYDLAPRMNVDVLKADHHGSCNGVTRRYLELLSPDYIAISVGGSNSFGHVNTQTKDLMSSMSIPWYRTDQNGTVTFRTPGTPGGGYTATIQRGGANMSGSTDATSASSDCTVL